MAAAAVLLAVEVATGSGYLLWPSAAAGVVALLNLAGLHLGWAGDAIVFAVLTIVSTLVTKRWFPRRLPGSGRDLNDLKANLIGHEGRAVTPFEDGRGRVFVEGKEWAAELDGADAPRPGGRVQVTAILGGATLKVRAA
jgi:membrane protein implicated in regulation of membrane protease activity